MINRLKYVRLAGFLIVIAILTLMGLVVSSTVASGAANTTLAIVNITNTEPHLNYVEIAPTPIIPMPGNTTQVNCTAHGWDFNGWGDVIFTNATLYHLNESQWNTSDDDNNHYTNDSCSCSSEGPSGTNFSCLCTFQVEYFASNGTWNCQYVIGDDEFYDTNNDTEEVVSIIGIGVPDEINYGNLSVSETSDFVPVNISNWGNLPINVTVRGWGGTDEFAPNASNYSMMCALGNISMNYARYSLNTTTPYENMTNLSYNALKLPDVDLPVRTDDLKYGNDTNTTFWKLYIPWTTGGVCNGTVRFTGALSEA